MTAGRRGPLHSGASSHRILPGRVSAAEDFGGCGSVCSGNEVLTARSPFRPFPGPCQEASLPAQPEAAAQARRLVGAALHRWRLPQLIDNAQLLTSELVTNAVTVAGAEASSCSTPFPDTAHRPVVGVRVQRTRTRVRLEVWDPDAALPTPAPVPGALSPEDDDDFAEGGRGLALVEVISADWGIYDGPHGGKVVWCDLIVPP